VIKGMKSGQFVKGKIDGIQKLFRSPNLTKVLSPEKLQELEDYTDIGEHPQFSKQGRALIKTVIIPAENSDGRRGGVINHTVIYSYDATVEYDGLKYIFDVDSFINEVLAGKRKFKMPQMPKLPDTDTGLIDLPPPIEWEA
jgi:hypothetical protein